MARGRKIESVYSSKSSRLRGMIDPSKIDPNFVRMRIGETNLDSYPDSVQMYVYFTDDKGNYIPHLAPPFEHTSDWKDHWNQVQEKLGDEEPIKKEIAEYSVREVNYHIHPPIAISCVLDYSGAMKARTVELEYAIENLTFMKRDTDHVSIVKYDDKVATEVSLTKSKKELFNGFQRDGTRRFGGKRAMYTACLEGIKTVKDFVGDRIVIAFTSGKDDASSEKYFEVVQAARDANTRLFIVGSDQCDSVLLRTMAHFGKGIFTYASTLSEMEEIVEDIYRSLINHYVVTYTPPMYFGPHRAVVQVLLPEADGDIFAAKTYMTNEFDPFVPVGQACPVLLDFEFNRADLKETAKSILDPITTCLKDNPNLQLEIRGNVDLVGKADYNKKLSEQRAGSVKNYFVQSGINADRLTTSGNGSMNQIAPNDTEQHRVLNRRTEFIVRSR